MRIFQVLEESANVSAPGNKTWLRNLYEPLVEMGHEVLLFSVTEGRMAMQHKDGQARACFSQNLLDTFRREHSRKPFVLFFSYLMDGMLEPGVIDEIRKYGVVTCNFSCNNIHQFYLVKEISPHFDYNLHSEKDTGYKFLAIGANPLWWPMASNPHYFKPLNLQRTIQASFVGANYALRARYIAYLLENGIDVHAYGPQWIGGARTHLRSLAKRYILLCLLLFAFDTIDQSYASAQLSDHDYKRNLYMRYPKNFHPPIQDDELISLYSKSEISLGFTEVYDNHDINRPIRQHLHLREFEAPMSGALYCTGYMDELAEMFEPDKEILTYKSPDELLGKIKYYLAHPLQAEKIRRAGRRRALAEHSYQVRFKKLFELLGLSNE